jgi:hypothetical protein
VARVGVDGDVLRIDLGVFERLCTFRAGFRIPLAHISAVDQVADVYRELRGWRLPGGAWPGKFAIGWWRGRLDGHRFADLALIPKRGPGLVLTVSGEAFERVLLQVDDATELLTQLAR